MREISPPIRLPYITTKLPDEIFGSWIGRVAHLSLSGAWAPYVEACGLSSHILSTFFFAPSHRLAPVVVGLGWNFEECVEQMTLEPYWRRFGTPQRGAPQRFHTINPQRGEAFGPRLCPACVAADWNQRGSAYWHREHQLPNVHGCRLHKCLLLDRCEVCHGLFRKMRGLMVPLTLFCECGAEIPKQLLRLDPYLPYWRLVDLSAEVLQSATAPLASSQTGAVLRHLAQVHRERTCDPIAANSPVTNPPRPVAPLRFKFRRDTASTREICIALSALELTLDDGLRLFDELAGTVPPHGKCAARDLSLQDCKRLLKSTAERTGIKNIGQLHPAAAWKVRLLDPRWVSTQFPSEYRLPIPTVAADRKHILKLLGSRDDNRRNPVPSSTAAMRARVRDLDWFRRTLRKAYESVHKTPSVSTDRQRIEALNSAITAITSMERPPPVSCEAISRFSGLSYRQVEKLLRANAQLKVMFVRAKVERVVLLLVARGKEILSDQALRLSKTSWIERAGLRKSVTLEAISEATRRLSAAGFAVPPRDYLPPRRKSGKHPRRPSTTDAGRPTSRLTASGL
jgi:hypothetical protein